MTAFLANGARFYATETLTGSTSASDYTELSEVSELPAIPDNVQTIPTTRIGDTKERLISGVSTGQELAITGFYDANDPGYMLLKSLRASGAEYRFEIDAGPKQNNTFVITGRVRTLSGPSFSQDSAQTFECTITVLSKLDDITTPDRTGAMTARAINDNPPGPAGGASGQSSGASGRSRKDLSGEQS